MYNVKRFKSLLMIVVATALATILFFNAFPALAAEGGGSHWAPGFYGDFGVAMAPEPGFILRNDFYYYAGEIGGERVVENGQLRANLEVDAAMYMLTGLKVLESKVLGGRYAFGALLPVIYTDIAADITLGSAAASLDANRTGFGDPAIVPVSLFWSTGDFHLNLYETITLPIGSYDINRDVNSGLNYWSFDTTLAGTYLHPEKGFEVSAVLGFVYNTENDETNYQTGQEMYLEYMFNQFLSETFAVGAHGFFYKQVSGDSGDGALLGDFKGEAAGIGPALMWATKVNDTDLVINAKWLYEFDAEKRLEGNHLYLALTLVF